MANTELFETLSKASAIPISFYSDDNQLVVRGWFPAPAKDTDDRRAAGLQRLPQAVRSWIDGRCSLGDGVTTGEFEWYAARHLGTEVYRAGVLVQRHGLKGVQYIVARLPGDKRFPDLKVEPDPTAAIKLVRETRVLPDDLPDPDVPKPREIWFDPAIVLGEDGPIVRAWLFSLPGERPTQVVVSLDGSSILAVVTLDPDNPYSSATTPRYLADEVTGVPRFVMFVTPLALLPGNVDAVAIAERFFFTFPAMFGTGNPRDQLQVVHTATDLDGGRHVFMQQYYAGVKVLGCQLTVHLSPRLAITSISGRYYPEPWTDISPTIGEATAHAYAYASAQSYAVEHRTTADKGQSNGLVILPRKLSSAQNQNELVWWFSFSDADRFISAQSGRMVVAIRKQIGVSEVYDQKGVPNNWPGQLQIRDGTVIVPQSDLAAEAESAAQAVQMIQDFWIAVARNGWDNKGADELVFLNSMWGPADLPGFWDGAAIFKPGMAFQDSIAHEFIHGVASEWGGFIRDNKSYESNALSESFSDVLGKIIIPTPQKWVMETRRNLAAPTISHYSQYDVTGEAHTNAGIGSRVAVRVAEGDGSTRHPGLGSQRMARIWWDTLTAYMSPWSRYIDLVVNAVEVTRQCIAKTSRGINHPAISGAPLPPMFQPGDTREVIWAFQESGLDAALQTGWFALPDGRQTELLLNPGGMCPPDYLVDDMTVMIQQRFSTQSRPVGSLQVSTDHISDTFFGGVVAAAILEPLKTTLQQGTRSTETRVSFTVNNYANIEASAIPKCRPNGPSQPPFITDDYATPMIHHWFDNPFFCGRKYGDIIYGSILLPPDCTVQDVRLELLKKNGAVVPGQITRLNNPGAVDGASGAWIFSRSTLPNSLDVKVRSWHDFGWSVRYRIVYRIISPPDFTMPEFRLLEVVPYTNL